MTNKGLSQIQIITIIMTTITTTIVIITIRTTTTNDAPGHGGAVVDLLIRTCFAMYTSASVHHLVVIVKLDPTIITIIMYLSKICYYSV
jgi:hypothetical protein